MFRFHFDIWGNQSTAAEWGYDLCKTQYVAYYYCRAEALALLGSPP